MDRAVQPAPVEKARHRDVACLARRGCTATHLVDHVIPRVPVRQWVLSFPIPLRCLFPAHPRLLAPVLQIVHRVISGFLIQQAGLKRTESKDKHTMALVEDVVESGGMYGENERIKLDREKLFEAFLGLSHTLGIWKKRVGRTLRVKILPDAVALDVGYRNRKCRYRFFINGSYTDWQDVTTVVPEPGGTFIEIQGCHEHYWVQLEVSSSQNTKWVSPVVAQWMQIQLNQEVSQ